MTKKQKQMEWKTRKQVQRMIPLENARCEKCNKDENLQRHHIDCNRYNNSRENLQVLCMECHIKTHLELGTYSEAMKYRNKKKVALVA